MGSWIVLCLLMAPGCEERCIGDGDPCLLAAGETRCDPCSGNALYCRDHEWRRMEYCWCREEREPGLGEGAQAEVQCSGDVARRPEEPCANSARTVL